MQPERISRFDRFEPFDKFLKLTVYQLEKSSGFDWAGQFERFFKNWFFRSVQLDKFSLFETILTKNVLFQLDIVCNWKRYRGQSLHIRLDTFCKLETHSRTRF